MDPRRWLARLLAPLAVGGELAGYTIEALSATHGMRVVLARDDARVLLDVDPRDDAFPSAARSARFAVSYRSGTPLRPIASREGLRVAEALASHLRAHEDVVLAALAEEALAARDTSDDGARVREVEVLEALEPAGQGEGRFETISPYVGCLVGCGFCYAQERLARLRALVGLAPLPWGSWVDARVNVASVLRQELRAPRPLLPIKLCPIVSDPYHAIERRLRLTRGVLEVLADDARREVFVLTRSALVEDDLPSIARSRAWLGFSIPTAREDVRRVLEPRSAPIETRLAILAAARARGIRTFVVIQPILDPDVAPLADAIARVTASAQLDVLRGTYGASEAFGDPSLAALAEPRTQAALADALRDALEARGVTVWDGELPPASAR